MPRAYLILRAAELPPSGAAAPAPPPLGGAAQGSAAQEGGPQGGVANELAARFAAATGGRCLVHTRQVRVIAGRHDGGVLSILEFASQETLQQGLDGREAQALLQRLGALGPLQLWAVSGVAGSERDSPHPFPAYCLGLVEITDRGRLAQLWNLVALLVDSRNGRFLVRGDDMRVIVGPPFWRRLLVVEMPSYPAMEDAVGAPGLADMLALAQESAKVDLWIVPGAHGVPDQSGGK
jgi:uncharacterized protein (DUF1330 family)